MKTVFFILSTLMLLSSVYNFSKSAFADDSVKQLLYANLASSQLIIGTLVVSKLSKDVEGL